MNCYAILFGRHRLVLACAVLAFTGFCVFGVSRVTFESDLEKLFRTDRMAAKRLDADFARLERSFIVVVEGDNLMTPEEVAAIREMVLRASKVQGVKAVHSILSVRGGRRVGKYLLPLFPSSEASADRFEQARRRVADHPMLIGHFLSKDMKTSLVIVEIDADGKGYTQAAAIQRQLHTVFAERTEATGLEARITGSPALEVEVFENLLEAAQSAIRHLGLACALTSLSTALGFGSLTLARLSGIKTFGWCCALGAIVSFPAVTTVVPLLASTPLSRFIIAPPRRGRPLIHESSADRLLSRILSHPRVVTGIGVTGALALTMVAVRLEPDHRVATAIPNTSESYQALEHVDKTFGGILFAFATVHYPDEHGPSTQRFYDVLQEVHDVFDASSLSSNPFSILNLVRSLPGEDRTLPRRAAQLRYVPRENFSQWIDLQGRRAVVSAHLPDVGARQLNPELVQIERQLKQIAGSHPGFQIELTGDAVVLFRSIHLMIQDLWRSLAAAAGIMFVMIWIGLRSLRFALVSVIPNVLPLLCAGAFIVLSGRYLEMTSVVVFSISLGIAVDDTIHFLVCFKREVASGKEPDCAVRHTFKVVGSALVMTTVTLVAGHAIVMLSGFPSVRVFGMLTALTLSSALVCDLLILPAMVLCLGRPRDSLAQGKA